jgi:hypothetical protein
LNLITWCLDLCDVHSASVTGRWNNVAWWRHVVLQGVCDIIAVTVQEKTNVSSLLLLPIFFTEEIIFCYVPTSSIRHVKLLWS